MGALAYSAIEPDSSGYVAYTQNDNEMWQELINTQKPLVTQRACQLYLDGLRQLDFPVDRVPQCDEVSTILTAATGWKVVPVDAVIGFSEFFQLLVNREFPAATFIRRREEMEYLKEPDIFHELFGHTPPLTHPQFADFVQAYGQYALSVDPQYYGMLARLFWFSVEFGLVKTDQGVKAIGAGILSSPKEVVYALDSDLPVFKPFDVVEILRTRYRIDILQPTYFVLESFEQLFDLPNQDLVKKIEEARKLGMYERPEEGDFMFEQQGAC